MRAGAVGAIERTAVVVGAALVGAVAGVDAGCRRAAQQIDEDVRSAGELERARDHQETQDLKHPARATRRGASL